MLTYYDDHTVTTDADDNRSKIWVDAQKRTTKTVDAEEAEVGYSYDAKRLSIARGRRIYGKRQIK